MPKRSNKPFRRFVRKTVGRVFNAADKITKTVGSMFCAVELAASTVTTVPMKPNNAFFGGRVQSFADCFNEFRFSSFRLTIYPQGHDVMIAYDSIPNSTSTSPAYADFGQLSTNVFHPAARVANSNFRLDRRALCSNLGVKWWNCRSVATDDQLEYQGQLYFDSGDAFTMKCKIEYVIEFVHPEPLADYISSDGPFRYPIVCSLDCNSSATEADEKQEFSSYSSDEPVNLAGPFQCVQPGSTPNYDDARLLAQLCDRLGVVAVRRRQRGSVLVGTSSVVSTPISGAQRASGP